MKGTIVPIVIGVSWISYFWPYPFDQLRRFLFLYVLVGIILCQAAIINGVNVLNTFDIMLAIIPWLLEVRLDTVYLPYSLDTYHHRLQ